MFSLIIICIFLVLFLVLTIPFLFIEWLIGKKHPDIRDRHCLAVAKWALSTIGKLTFSKVTYIGEENIPSDTPVLYIGNHQSYFDVVFLYARFPKPTGGIAKLNMIKVPLVSTWMKFLHCLFLNRNDLRQGLKTILQGVAEMKNGISMFIFPEGTRAENPDQMLPFKEGSLKLAEKSKCPIIPVAITGTRNIWEAHLPFIKPAKVVIRYGEPIYLDNLEGDDKKFSGAYVQRIIEKMYLENKELL